MLKVPESQDGSDSSDDGSDDCYHPSGENTEGEHVINFTIFNLFVILEISKYTLQLIFLKSSELFTHKRRLKIKNALWIHII